MWKKLFVFLILALAACGGAKSQGIPTVPQSQQQRLATNVTCTGAQQIYTVTTLGMTVHFVSYNTLGGVQKMSVRLQALDGLGNIATEVATPTNEVLSGTLLGVGYFPTLRVIVVCSGAGVTNTFTMSYAGTSTAPGMLVGSMGTSLSAQIIMYLAPGNVDQTVGSITTPYGNSNGKLLFSYVGASLAGSTVDIQCGDKDAAGLALPTFSFAPANIQGNQTFRIPPSTCPGMTVNYTSGGATTALVTMVMDFEKSPGMAGGSGSATVAGLLQPANTLNTETASVANTAVTTSIAALPGKRVYLFAVAARCSAGTSTLTVKDGVGGTTIWDTAAGEVGTTTTKFSWMPGLASSLSLGMDITLATCGPGNTGTLIVQTSQQ